MAEKFTVPDEIAIRVPIARLRAVTEAIFARCGVPESDAAAAADVLMFADSRGVDTHGVSNKLRDYVQKYSEGSLNPRPDVQVVTETPATAVIDGDWGSGLVVASRAMDLAIEKAAAVGVGAVAVRNAGHVGALGYYAMQAVQRDMVGLCTAVSPARKGMIPTFGSLPLLGTDPIAFGAPARNEAPFLFDAAMTTIAGNRIGLAQRLGAPLQGGWVANADGTPNMVGAAAGTFEAGKPMQLPLGSNRDLGSHKGYGLAVMVEVLSGHLSFAPGFATMADNRGGHFVTAYDLRAFGDPDEFKDAMDGYLRALRESPPMPGEERVLYAGLPDAEIEAERIRLGIPLHPEVIDWFRTACADLDIEFDLA